MQGLKYAFGNSLTYLLLFLFSLGLHAQQTPGLSLYHLNPLFLIQLLPVQEGMPTSRHITGTSGQPMKLRKMVLEIWEPRLLVYPFP